LSDTEWIIGGDFNMVEWEGDMGSGVGLVVCGSKKQASLRCKVTFHLFDPN
jgi:hypothetical protein